MQSLRTSVGLRFWPLALCSAFLLILIINVISKHTLVPQSLFEGGESLLDGAGALAADKTLADMRFTKRERKSKKEKQLPQTMLDLVKSTTIVCFGDSLTHGLFVAENGDWQKTHPYSLNLARLLKNETTVVTAGVNGELTTEMVLRLPKVLANHRLNRLVIILGGTNDLGHRKSASHTLANIIALHKIAHNSSSDEERFPVFSLAMTIPPARWPFSPQTRADINKGIREFARSDCHTAILDIEEVYNQSVPANSKYWSQDFVHFSPLGYDLLAEKIYDVLMRHVVSEKCPRNW